jgi:hypothetical protein
MSKHRRFDRSRLDMKALAKRTHDLTADVVKPLRRVEPTDPAWREVAERMMEARRRGRAIVFMMGAHVIRAGVQHYIIDLIERGYITCVAMNGGSMIHDFELARVGATTESVSRYVREGQFGLWRETGELNDIINGACEDDLGMGEAVGRAIDNGDCPHKDISLLAACHRRGIPATVHIGIGYDIIHEHANCSGAATGETSYRDFLAFTAALENLEGGVVSNFGSAVMAPEVYLKALSMVRNVAHQKGDSIQRFTTLVCDMRELPGDLSVEPTKSEAAYYYRPLKTMLVRTVADGGKSYYIRGMHADTVPALWSAIHDAEDS